jgi:hypothetical protein
MSCNISQSGSGFIQKIPVGFILVFLKYDTSIKISEITWSMKPESYSYGHEQEKQAKRHKDKNLSCISFSEDEISYACMHMQLGDTPFRDFAKDCIVWQDDKVKIKALPFGNKAADYIPIMLKVMKRHPNAEIVREVKKVYRGMRKGHACMQLEGIAGRGLRITKGATTDLNC